MASIWQFVREGRPENVVGIRMQKLLEKFSELFEEVLAKKEREIMTV